MSVNVIELSVYTQPAIKESTRDEWVEYGEKNDYYTWLIDRYRNSPTNNAVINHIVRLAYGKGLSARDASRKPNEYARMLSMVSKDTLRNVITDLKCLGNATFQVIYSKDRKSTPKIEHLPQHLLRPEKCDKDGNVNAWYYSDNWDDVRKFPPRRIPVFGTSSESIEILVMGKYSLGRKYFSTVDYEGALDYCVLEEEIASYLINETKNSFSPTMVVNFNNGQGDEESRERTARQVENKLTGSTGKKVVISFNDNETLKTTVDAIPLNDAPQHYEYLSKEAQSKILSNHGVTSSMLVGITTESQGFNSNADEIQTASKYFHNTVIIPLQEIVLDALETILAFNGIALDLFFKRLNLLEDLEEVKTDVQMSSQDLDTLIFNELDKYADNDLEGWELVDSQKVDYDTEDELDAYLNELNSPKQSLLSKVWNFVSTGTARPNTSSEQDGNIFKSRYRYTGDVKDNSREFCKKMVKANKVYRKEDIIQMGSQVVNKGWGPEGADTYSIWLYKGGGACGHYWVRETYLRKSDVNNPNARKYTPAEVRKAGELVPLTDKDKNGKQVNDKRVYTAPKDMPYEGFLPTNKRFQ
jgi:hypothetical protein